MPQKNVTDNPATGGESPLSTNGELSITFVGTGGAFSKRFYQTNVIIAKGPDHVLVDCGTRTPEALDRMGIPVTKLDRCLITHTHADHVGGLEEVMLVNRYAAKRKPGMIVTDLLKGILWNQTLRGGAAWNEAHEGKPLSFEDFWVQETPKRVRGGDRELCAIRVGSLGIHLFRTMHIPDSAADWKDSFPSYGLVLDEKVLYSGDTRFDPALLEWVLGTFPIETIFHDAQLFTGGVHASIDELASLPPEIKSKMTLMHYGDKMPEMKESVAKLGFAGMAEQGRTYSF
ncbi:MAG TPA: MBL fold metallo-hydrolase [Rectinemataceae bacterium]|nr:MBL fold metallo-hydrolase [Rectinemataceae bacterium]